MVKFPSIPAAILSGALAFPCVELGMRFIEARFHNPPFLSPMLSLFWLVFAFVVPAFFATMDIYGASRKRGKGGGIYQLMLLYDDPAEIYRVLARLGAMFLAGVISISALKTIGLWQ